MPKDMVPTNSNPALELRLPGWLTDILDTEHPDVPWRVPDRLPTPGDLRSAIGKCDATLDGQVTPAYAKQCLGKLLVAFEPNTKLSADDMRLRAAVWLEACGDLNDALWNEATLESIRSLKWMPKPAEFRALVDPKREQARKRKARLQEMLQAHTARPAAKPFVEDPEDVKLRTLRDSFRRIGKLGKAAGYERSLARLEKRDPEAWATGAIPETAEARPDRPPFVPSQSPTAQRCAELAKERRQNPEAA